MPKAALQKGDIVEFGFTIESPIASQRGERRPGIGTIYDNEVNYSCWPPGRSVKVTSSEHYKPGQILAVATHNLRKLRGGT